MSCSINDAISNVSRTCRPSTHQSACEMTHTLSVKRSDVIHHKANKKMRCPYGQHGLRISTQFAFIHCDLLIGSFDRLRASISRQR